MPGNLKWGQSVKYARKVQNRLFEVRKTRFVRKIFILDHKFLYNICSTRQDLQNELLHE